MSFEGFPAAALDFYDDLEVDNTRSFWEAHKHVYNESVLGPFNAKEARPGLTMLMVSTTGEHSGYYVLDEALRPIEAEMPRDLRLSVERIQENCEPALCTVLFMGGAGGSLCAGVTATE